jgi:hypothetical protein
MVAVPTAAFMGGFQSFGKSLALFPSLGGHPKHLPPQPDILTLIMIGA